jgi:hypothetical protein
VSAQLGKVKYKNAVCCGLKSRIYISAVDENENNHLFVYDLSTGLWHREDSLRAETMLRVGTDVYFVNALDNSIGTFTGKGEKEADFEWYAQTGEIGYSLPDNKYIERILLRISKPLTSTVELLINYDDNITWQTVARFSGDGIKSYSIPVLPQRCDHFKLRLQGKGECKVYSISKKIKTGSDL